jgi:radical SAM superfamily enzyme YgiQ (UPF0313 family)
MPYKLLLINPANHLRKGFVNHETTIFMPLGLGIVAALTPSGWEVELIDESFEEFSFKPADLVAFTGFTANAPRAYEIAAHYRKVGIHTVMGGIHATMCTNEVARHIDTVFTGEAEGSWPSLIADFEAGKVKQLYDGGIVNTDSIGIARRDIFERYPYHYDSVQTSRGCPLGCDFCSVTQMCGKTYREREVKDILDELEKTSHRLLFFVDDNLINQKKGANERAISLFKGMVERGIKKYWFSQAALNFADSDEVLHWARKSGCMMVLMGIEAENPNALKDIRKNFNLKRGVGSYEKVLRKIHKHGISVLATMIFGMESDRKEDLYARRDFILNSSIDTYQCTILTPMPGTILFERMKGNHMIELNNYPADWQHYDAMEAAIHTSNFSMQELETTMREIWYSLYNKETMRKKMFRTWWNTRSLRTAFWAYSSIHNYGRMFLERFFETDPYGINKDFYWKNRERSFYLKFTDAILWIIYQLFWKKTMRRFSRNS